MINLKMEGWTQTMDENTKVKVDEKIKDLMALAKKKKNVLEYQEITDCLAGLGLEIEQIEYYEGFKSFFIFSFSNSVMYSSGYCNLPG